MTTTPEREALAAECKMQADEYAASRQRSNIYSDAAQAERDKLHAAIDTLAASPAAGGVQALPMPGSPEASAMIDSMLAERGWPASTKNAARAGYEAARRMLAATPPAAPAPTRGQKLAEAGYTRRPSLREFPREDDAPASDEREALAVCPSCKGSGTRTYQHLDDYEEGDCDRCSGTGVLAARAPQAAAEGQERTGWPPGLLQDDSRALSRALAGKPDAKLHAREAAAAIAAAPQPTVQAEAVMWAAWREKDGWLDATARTTRDECIANMVLAARDEGLPPNFHASQGWEVRPLYAAALAQAMPAAQGERG